MTCLSKSFSRKNGEMVCNECHTSHAQARPETPFTANPVHDCIRDGCTTASKPRKSRTSRVSSKVGDVVEDIVDGICDMAAGIANGIGKMLD